MKRQCHFHFYRLVLLLAGVSTSMPAWSQQVFPPVEEMPPTVCVSEQVIHHSNLFHLSNSVTDIEQRLGAGASRDDTVFQTSACANGDWQFAQQAVVLNLLVDDNRYLNNDMLNHTSGAGRLLWNWRTAGDWYGELGGNYRHALGTFLNDRALVKDLVDALQYFGELNHDIGAHVTVTLDGAQTDTSHDAQSRQIDNYRSTRGGAGLTVTSSAENYIGVNYRRTRASYPYDVVINDAPLDRDYQEDTESLRFRYALANKTVLRGTAGYVKRDYPNAEDNNYSGSTWRVGLNWQPTSQAQVDLVAWKELGAYFDSEADHFVTRGASLTPIWAPRDKLKFSVLASWAKQQFLASSLTLLETTPREDKVLVAGLDVWYRPVDFLDFDLSYNHEQHDSSLAGYDYTDRVAMLRLRARF